MSMGFRWYAELDALLAALSDRDQRRFSELAGLLVARQPSPFAPRPSDRPTTGR